MDCVGGIQLHHIVLPSQYHGRVSWSETSSARVCDVKFEICLLQIHFKKHFQFAVPTWLLPGKSCIVVFFVAQTSKRQEHIENRKL